MLTSHIFVILKWTPIGLHLLFFNCDADNPQKFPNKAILKPYCYFKDLQVIEGFGVWLPIGVEIPSFSLIFKVSNHLV